MYCWKPKLMLVIKVIEQGGFLQMYLEIQGSKWASIVRSISDEQQTGYWNMVRGMGVHPYQLCPKVCAGPIVEHFKLHRQFWTLDRTWTLASSD